MLRTEQELRRDIDELQRQKRELDARLRGGFAGRGRGGFGFARNGEAPHHLENNGRGARDASRGGANRGRFAGRLGRYVPPHSSLHADTGDAPMEDAGLPARKKRIMSAISGAQAADTRDTNAVEPDEAEELGRAERQRAEAVAGDGEEAPTTAPSRMERARPGRRPDPNFDPPEPQQRPPGQPEDALTKKRNRRMFGVLLGTLDRFRQEEKLSTAAARQAEALKKAEERAAQDRVRILQEQRANERAKREEEMALRNKIVEKTEERHVELLFLRWQAQHQRLSLFHRTKAQPSIYYMPKQPSQATDQILKQQQEASCTYHELQERDKTSVERLATLKSEALEMLHARRNQRGNRGQATAPQADGEEMDQEDAPKGPRRRRAQAEEEEEDIEVDAEGVRKEELVDAANIEDIMKE
eukprot:jgi/Chlat1/362/Chrsp10S01478